MKKIILFLMLIMLLKAPAFALDEFKDVGIEKYAVLEVIKDNTPLRDKASESAKRLSHLYKDTVIFATQENEKYFKVELDNKLNSYINKNSVEVQAIIPEKRTEAIKKLFFSKERRKYLLKIETNPKTAYVIREYPTALDFKLYDNVFDPSDIDLKQDIFIIPNKIEKGLNIKYRTDKPLFGYGIENFEKGYIYFVKKAPKISQSHPLRGIRITVDPGHGGVERGACANDLEEKDLNLQISKRLRRELAHRGAKAYLTRKSDIKVDLYDRVAFAKEKNSDILISIHQNSLENRANVSKKHGTGTYYYNNQSKALAEYIQKEMLEATKFKDDKVNYASFALTRPTDFISVLVECGYIIHPEEAQKLSDKKFQKLVAKAIAKGVEEYLLNTY